MIEKKPLMMLIDDLKSSRMIIKKVLKDDFNYVEANDGIEAIKLLNEYTPDIILIDAIMPNMDGFETIKNIRKLKKYKRTPILMITSLNHLKIKIKALESGVNDFLTKPFDKYELIARCKSYMEIVKLNQQCHDNQINPTSGFLNEIALIKDILPSDGIFLISINDFHKIKGIYGYKNSKIIEKKFAFFVLDFFKKYISNINVYHVGNAKYVVKINSNQIIENKKIKTICENFYNKCLDLDIFIEDIKFNPKITMVYLKDRINLYEDAMSALGYAKINNIKYIFNQDDINGIKDIVYSNIEILKKVKKIIDNKDVINLYQPIVDNLTKRVTKYETLVRLKSKSGELLSPNSFLDIIKNVQLYEELTKIVFKKAFDKFKYSSKEFSINISYIDIKNKSIREYIFDILSQNPHVSNRVIFEIKEDLNSYDLGLIKEFITQIKKYEAKIALDDFGESHSKFQHIFQLEPNYIKIDGKIVRNILFNYKNYTILEGINKFSHTLGIKTIAKHVSNQEIFNEIINLNIDFSQGFYIGKPSKNILNESMLNIS